VRFLAYSDTLQTAQLLLMAKKLKAAAAAEGSITAEGRGSSPATTTVRSRWQMLLRGMDGLQTEEAMWRQAAQLGTLPAAETPKIQTLTGMLPVVAVVPKGRKGQRTSSGIAALAIDFDALASA